MPTRREQVLSAVFSRLGSIPDAEILRNVALPVRIPEAGLIIMRDGDPGLPDVTLNPRTEFYSHRIPVEVITTGDEAALDRLLITVGEALSAADTLGGLAEMVTVLAPDVGVTPIEGAAMVRHATIPLVVEYQVTGILKDE
ncbi:MAG: acyl-CoA transferase [Alphaproteobacteria bacterium]